MNMSKILTVVMGLALFGAVAATAQTDTNCTTNGNQTNCTTQPNSTAAGAQAGAGMAKIGMAIARNHAKHKLEKFCYDNPGQVYKGMQCETLEEQVRTVAAEFRDQTPKFKQCKENATMMTDWFSARYTTDDSMAGALRNIKLWKTCYKELSKAGKLQLNKV